MASVRIDAASPKHAPLATARPAVEPVEPVEPVERVERVDLAASGSGPRPGRAHRRGVEQEHDAPRHRGQAEGVLPQVERVHEHGRGQAHQPERERPGPRPGGI